jgi:hypothetical protein
MRAAMMTGNHPFSGLRTRTNGYLMQNYMQFKKCQPFFYNGSLFNAIGRFTVGAWTGKAANSAKEKCQNRASVRMKLIDGNKRHWMT